MSTVYFLFQFQPFRLFSLLGYFHTNGLNGSTALHAERIQTSFLGNDHILLSPCELLDHYQLEQKLSQQLDHEIDRVSAWSELSQISDKMSGNVAMMISTNPMNQNPKDGFFAASVAFMHRLNAIPGLVEMLALVLIWFLLPKPLFE